MAKCAGLARWRNPSVAQVPAPGLTGSWGEGYSPAMLSACRECTGKVSTEAVTCPHCGVPDPALAKEQAPAPTPRSDSAGQVTSSQASPTKAQQDGGIIGLPPLPKQQPRWTAPPSDPAGRGGSSQSSATEAQQSGGCIGLFAILAVVLALAAYFDIWREQEDLKDAWRFESEEAYDAELERVAGSAARWMRAVDAQPSRVEIPGLVTQGRRHQEQFSKLQARLRNSCPPGIELGEVLSLLEQAKISLEGKIGELERRR